MRLDSIELVNFRRYERFSMDIESSFTVIVGVNGSGKTSLLKGIREALHGLVQFMNVRGAFLPVFGEPGSVRIKPTQFENRFRFERQYPVTVSATGVAFDTTCSWSVSAIGEGGTFTWGGKTPGVLLHELRALPDGNAKRNNANVLPIVAFYPAYRQWPTAKLNELAAATEKNERTDGYQYWADASADSTGLQQWIVAKSWSACNWRPNVAFQRKASQTTNWPK